MFFQLGLDAYLIGSFNQFRFHIKGRRFMLRVEDMLVENE